MNGIDIVESIGVIQRISSFYLYDIKLIDDEKTNEALQNMLKKRQDDIFALECYYRKRKNYEITNNLFPERL